MKLPRLVAGVSRILGGLLNLYHSTRCSNAIKSISLRRLENRNNHYRLAPPQFERQTVFMRKQRTECVPQK